MLEVIGLGSSFILDTMIRMLYANPTATVLTGWTCSLFNIAKCSRQGCPLIPFLFALCLELLSQATHMANDITPITICGTKHHIFLCADDCLLYVGNVQQSIPNISSIFRHFVDISRCRINWSSIFTTELSSEEHNTALGCTSGTKKKC